MCRSPKFQIFQRPDLWRNANKKGNDRSTNAAFLSQFSKLSIIFWFSHFVNIAIPRGTRQYLFYAGFVASPCLAGELGHKVFNSPPETADRFFKIAKQL